MEDAPKPWIQDPISSCAWQGKYECIVTIFWVIKGLMGWILLERKEKEHGDVVPIEFWKELYVDTQLLHMKINVVGRKHGIPFLSKMGLVGPTKTFDRTRGIVEVGGSILVGARTSFMEFQVL